MSNVPKLRFKEFSGEWEEKSFRDLVKLQRGSSPRPIVKYITKSEDGVNWIKIGDTKSNDMYIYTTEEKITKEGAEKSRRVSIGEIILSNSMSYGKPYILKIDGYIHDGWFVIRKFENDFNKGYLLQLLGSEWIQKQYKRLAAGGVVSNISSELVNSVLINIPSKQEQEKIASFLTSVDSKIEQLTKKEELLLSYKNGVMQKIFSGEIRFKADDGSEFCDWEEKKLGDLTKIVVGGTPSTTNDEYWTNGTVNWLSSGDIKNGIIKKSSKMITELGLSKSSAKIMPKDTVVLAMTGATLGRIGYLDIETSGNQSVAGMIPNSKFEAKFLFYTLQKNTNIILSMAGGAAQAGINKATIESLEFSFPCQAEQTKIANFLSSIDSKIEQVQKQLASTKEFKKALLQQMFV